MSFFQEEEGRGGGAREDITAVTHREVTVMNTPMGGGVWGQSRVNLLFALLLCLVKLFFPPSFQLFYKKKTCYQMGLRKPEKMDRKQVEIMDYGRKEGKRNEGKKNCGIMASLLFSTILLSSC